MAPTPTPMSATQRNRLRLGIVINGCAAVVLLALGIAKGLAIPLVLGVVELLISAWVLRTYRRTPVSPGSGPGPN